MSELLFLGHVGEDHALSTKIATPPLPPCNCNNQQERQAFVSSQRIKLTFFMQKRGHDDFGSQGVHHIN